MPQTPAEKAAQTVDCFCLEGKITEKHANDIYAVVLCALDSFGQMRYEEGKRETAIQVDDEFMKFLKQLPGSKLLDEVKDAIHNAALLSLKNALPEEEVKCNPLHTVAGDAVKVCHQCSTQAGENHYRGKVLSAIDKITKK